MSCLPFKVSCHTWHYLSLFLSVSVVLFITTDYLPPLSPLPPPPPPLPLPLPLPPSSPVVAVEIQAGTQVNLSTHHTGSNLTIGCTVKTCAQQVNVQFLKGDKVLKRLSNQLSSEGSDLIVVHTLTVGEDITGTYACKADTTNADATAMELFEIFGMLHSRE